MNKDRRFKKLVDTLGPDVKQISFGDMTPLVFFSGNAGFAIVTALKDMKRYAIKVDTGSARHE